MLSKSIVDCKSHRNTQKHESFPSSSRPRGRNAVLASFEEIDLGGVSLSGDLRVDAARIDSSGPVVVEGFPAAHLWFRQNFASRLIC